MGQIYYTVRGYCSSATGRAIDRAFSDKDSGKDLWFGDLGDRLSGVECPRRHRVTLDYNDIPDDTGSEARAGIEFH